MQGASPLASPGVEPARRWLFSAVSVFLCPYPPDPLPPWGRGRLYTLFRRGLTPPAPLRNKPARHWLRAGNKASGGAWGAMGAAGREGASSGGACVFYSPGLFLVYHKDFAPIPPTPFPLGEGGDFRLFYARGFAPCIPGLNPDGTGFSFGRRCPRGACPRGCRLALLCRYPRGAYLSPRLPPLP